MHKVSKTTFEIESREKEDAFLKLTPQERLEFAFKMKSKMRKPGINYSFTGKKVTVRRLK